MKKHKDLITTAFCLEQAQLDEIDRVSKRNHISRSVFYRMAINDFLEKIKAGELQSVLVDNEVVPNDRQIQSKSGRQDISAEEQSASGGFKRA